MSKGSDAVWKEEKKNGEAPRARSAEAQRQRERERASEARAKDPSSSSPCIIRCQRAGECACRVRRRTV